MREIYYVLLAKIVPKVQVDKTSGGMEWRRRGLGGRHPATAGYHFFNPHGTDYFGTKICFECGSTYSQPKLFRSAIQIMHALFVQGSAWELVSSF